MKQFISIVVVSMCCVLLFLGQVQGNVFEGWLCAGQPWATPYYIIEGHEVGPTIVIVGGTHGDEEAGIAVAQELCHYYPDRGRLILIPEANRRSVAEGVREVSGEGNLNRCYPGNTTGLPMEQLAFVMFQLFEETQPDLVLDLHESNEFHRRDPNYVGQTLIAGAGEESIWLGMLAMERLNLTIAEGEEQFMLLHQPVQGSTTWAVGALLHTPAYTVETCQTMSLSRRKQYQHMVIENILHEFGVKLACNSTY